jgi:hypothetical protein
MYTQSTLSFHTGKNFSKKIINYKYKQIIPKIYKLKQKDKIISFNSIPKRNSDLTLSNPRKERNKCNSFFSSQKNYSLSQSLKLIPIIKTTSFRSFYNKLIDFSSESNKNKNFVNLDMTNYKNKVNESIQYNLNSDVEENKKYNFTNDSIIDCLMNEKLKIKLPKLKQMNFDKSSTIENLKELYGKKIFPEKYEKKFLQIRKPVQHYFKNNNVVNTIDKKKLFSKTQNHKNENIYDIVEFGNIKEKVATKLIIEENDDKNEDKIDCHCLMKYPIKYPLNNNSICSNTTNIFSNFSTLLKNKLKERNLKKKDIILNHNDLKMISRKGFEAMKIKTNKEYSKKINKAMKEINLNRKKYNSLSEKNFKIFNKNKNEILNNDLY